MYGFLLKIYNFFGNKGEHINVFNGLLTLTFINVCEKIEKKVNVNMLTPSQIILQKTIMYLSA